MPNRPSPSLRRTAWKRKNPGSTSKNTTIRPGRSFTWSRPTASVTGSANGKQGKDQTTRAAERNHCHETTTASTRRQFPLCAFRLDAEQLAGEDQLKRGVAGCRQTRGNQAER